MPSPSATLTLTVFEIISSPELAPRGPSRLAHDESGNMWEYAAIRHRPHYVCTAGVEHARWWRMYTKGGRDYGRDRRCAEHEVVEIIAPDCHEI